MKHYIGFVFLLSISVTTFSQNIQIRDSKSELSSIFKPLVVLDGKVLPKLVKSKSDSSRLIDPLTDIEPSDIERMEILKDESATLAYGEAGKNGVLIITTKKQKRN